MRIVVRHGIFSNAENMTDLEAALDERLAGSVKGLTTNNEDYDWKLPVLRSGLELASRLVQLEGEGSAPVVLVGHSQGGLVARVAATLICGTRRPQRNLEWYQPEMLKWQRANNSKRKPRLLGVITVATPNAGAFSLGQLSMKARWSLLAANNLTSFLRPGFFNNFEDLTTDRLFRTLQGWEVTDVQYMSISGSAVNRYNSGGLPRAMDTAFRRIGANHAIPNDGLVENASVDLREAVLPHEVANSGRDYEHVRSYIDCTTVNHVDIHQNPLVIDEISARIRKWHFTWEKSQQAKEAAS